jgi:hypothetical protein
MKPAILKMRAFCRVEVDGKAVLTNSPLGLEFQDGTSADRAAKLFGQKEMGDAQFRGRSKIFRLSNHCEIDFRRECQDRVDAFTRFRRRLCGNCWQGGLKS